MLVVSRKVPGVLGPMESISIDDPRMSVYEAALRGLLQRMCEEANGPGLCDEVRYGAIMVSEELRVAEILTGISVANIVPVAPEETPCG